MTEVAIDKDQIVANATYFDVPDTIGPSAQHLFCEFTVAQ